MNTKKKSKTTKADKVASYGALSVVGTSAGTYALRMSTYNDYNFEQFLNAGAAAWDSDPVSIAGIRCVPWGPDDNLPAMVRDLLEKNNLGPGILTRKTGLIYGQGPALYHNKLEDNEINREWCEDADIQEWLESWDYKRYIRNAIIEYNHMGGVFVKYISGKGIRIGRKWISELKALASKDCRLVWPESGFKDIDSVTSILVGDFESFRQREIFQYPVFNRFNPSANEVAIKYHSLRNFGRNFYAVSSFLGSLPWMENANELPRIIKALNQNMMAGAYIIHEPSSYWEDRKMSLIEMYPEDTMSQIQARLNKLREEVTATIAEVMAGSKNAGKFFTAVDFVDPATGKDQSWKIEPIEMNIDKYIDAQVKVSRIADSSTTSGFGLSPALSNLIIDGKSDSGSQMLYALKIFFGSDTQIPEDIVLEPINDAIAINFPNKKGIKLGLYRQMINKEDNVTATDRATNNI
jgi:hypothetical protein